METVIFDFKYQILYQSVLTTADLDARPWDFQAEECALRASVDRFNNRRYTQVNVSFRKLDNLGTSSIDIFSKTANLFLLIIV